MDDQLRRVERQALSGDPEAKILLQQLYGRLGLYFRDREREEILSEPEEIQGDFDEIWWHRRKALRLDWDGDPKPSICKAHHPWGHRGWGAKNAKRQTLRTHRDGSRRNYRL